MIETTVMKELKWDGVIPSWFLYDRDRGHEKIIVRWVIPSFSSSFYSADFGFLVFLNSIKWEYWPEKG